MTVRLFNSAILHLLYDIFFVVVTVCVFCHDGNKGFTYLLTYLLYFFSNILYGITLNGTFVQVSD